MVSLNVLGVICCLIVLLPQAWSSCMNVNFTDCTYTIRCTNGAGRVEVPSCSKAPQVTLVVAGSRVEVLLKSYFSSTSFFSRVRFFVADNNSWTTLDKNCFGYFMNTQHLDLSVNNIRTIRDDTFTGLTKMLLLNLSRNSIADFTSRSFYIGTTNALVTLDLSYNKINQLKAEIFKNLKLLKNFDVSHNFISSLSDNCFSGLIKLQTINFTHNLLDTFNATLFGLKDMRFLDASYNRFNKLDSYEYMRLKLIEDVNFSHNLITYLDGDLLHPFAELRTIDLSFNRIGGKILTSTFMSNTKLLKVNICHNQITYIEEKAFAKTSIKEFIFTDNNFIGDILKFTFQGMKLMDRLDLSNQTITALRSMAFSELTRLRFLNLSRNSIEVLESESFGSGTSLQVLDLSYNRIKYLNGSHFAGLKDLQKLYLQNNALANVLSSEFFYLSSLNTLNLTNNGIRSFDAQSLPMKSLKILLLKNNHLSGQIRSNLFSPAPLLSELDISESNFTEIKNESFANMPEIRLLNISHNKVRNIEFYSFTDLEIITILDLSHNDLSEIVFEKNGMLRLCSFYASNNKIRSVSSDIFEPMRDLELIDLSHNRIINILPNSFTLLTKLQTLLLGSNQISNFNVFTKYSKIVVLDISKNHLIKFDVTFFKDLIKLDLSENEIELLDNKLVASKNISHLNLSGNNISSIKPGIFTGLSSLRYLNLSKNHITNLRFGSLRGLLNLEIVDISQNYLIDLNVDLFHECPTLKYLLIDGNFIKSVDVLHLHSVVKSLERLSIGGNPMSCKEVIGHLRDANNSMTLEIDSIEKVYHEDNINGIQCGDIESSLTTLSYTDKKSNNIVQNNALVGITLTWCLIMTVFIVIIFIAMYYFRRNLIFLYANKRFEERRISLELESS